MLHVYELHHLNVFVCQHKLSLALSAVHADKVMASSKTMDHGLVGLIQIFEL